MVKKENKLKKRKQFNYLFRKGKSVFLENLTLIYLPCKTKNYKIGYSVSKKVGKAVVRNKVKRRLKEAFRIISSNVEKNYYYILVPKNCIVDNTFVEICESVKQIFKKAGLLYE